MLLLDLAEPEALLMPLPAPAAGEVFIAFTLGTDGELEVSSRGRLEEILSSMQQGSGWQFIWPGRPAGTPFAQSVALGGSERVVEIGMEYSTGWPDVVFLSGVTAAGKVNFAPIDFGRSGTFPYRGKHRLAVADAAVIIWYWMHLSTFDLPTQPSLACRATTALVLARILAV
jgi:hypothetical protein